jgi:hypothetical protein
MITPCPSPRLTAGTRRFLCDLARDRSGNAMALVAAALVPLVAMLGSGIDISRAYTTESRLQQACDAGALAARKRIGSSLPPSGLVIGQARLVGEKFFDLNFRDGRYDTYDKDFQMSLEPDYSVTGEATLKMPTTIMGIFGFDQIPISVKCTAQLNFTNLDIMMAVDTTGSMAETNPGDTLNKLDSVRAVIRRFRTNLEASKAPATRIRYGFVPYNANVNVGALLRNQWIVPNWNYQSRVMKGQTTTAGRETVYTNWTYVSGTLSPWTTVSEYDASVSESGGYACTGGQPSGSKTINDTFEPPREEPYAGPPEGTQTVEDARRVENGTVYDTIRDGTVCRVRTRTYTNYTHDFQRINRPVNRTATEWTYRPVNVNTGGWRNDTRHCIEERASSEIADYDNVDLSVNRDLDIDAVPVNGNPATQWRPQYHSMIYARYNPRPTWSVPAVDTVDNFERAGTWWMSACPAPSRQLAEMSESDLDTYLATLNADGSTYHDIGMIWAGRLLSPSGLLAAENAPVSPNQPTSRHLIFLTDGQTQAFDLTYGAYGLEPLDRRRWSPGSPMSLVETIEERFLFACKEVKKRNITVWIIAFGTEANDKMVECAGSGYYFEAADSEQLDDAFEAIARTMGDLRISQ